MKTPGDPTKLYSWRPAATDVSRPDGPSSTDERERLILWRVGLWGAAAVVLISVVAAVGLHL